MRCTYCGSERVVERNGEYVCMDCGTVLGPVYVFDTYTQQASPLNDSEEVDLTPIWKSIERSIGDISVRLSIYRKLRIIHRRFRIRSGNDSSIQRAMECVRDIARRLGIGNEYVEEARGILMKLVNVENRDYTYYHAAVAAMLYVILSRGLPVSTRDVISLCRSLGHKVTFESVRTALVSIGGVKYSVRDRIEAFIKAGLVRVFGDEWVTLYPKAIEVLNSLGRFTIQSKNPLTLAAAIIYCVGKGNGYDVKIEGIANALSVSQFTLRDYVKKYLNC
ncbi:TFIIB-type zinc ribbon-containing protein [Vulcanisaeta thermophila]|uniref:TFIIB-type zinc ribbon-containing protein n=1 Tax=Vulcanisaeta thermophila TaxID=867917 RepID=UPI000852F4F8|nr:hypothetical protein [Vulcanisaeta thermophila]